MTDTPDIARPDAPVSGPAAARFRHRIATSNNPTVTRLKALRLRLSRVGIALPPPAFRPLQWCLLLIRGLWHTPYRILVCEPLFRSYCHRVGRRFRTGIFVHWVQGKGHIVIGDDVTIDGRSSFTFAATFSEVPTLIIGDRTTIGHGCSFVVGKRISIGQDCLIARDVTLVDSSGHPLDPDRRKAHLPPDAADVRPIVIEDNVWLGEGVRVMPGTTIGHGAVVAAGSVVGGSIPPNALVAGYPARKLRDVTG